MKNRSATLTLLILVLLTSLFPFSLPHHQHGEDLRQTFCSHKSTRAQDGDATISVNRTYTVESLTLWEHVVTSTHFSIHYNTTGPHATTHEYAQNISTSLEYSWTTEVSTFGFNAPPDSHMTVYLQDLPFGTYGWIFAYDSPTGYHVYNITIDVGMNAGLANATCAHEFFHTIQLSYDPLEGDWIKEGTATWIESKVYPEYVGFASYVDAVNLYMINPDRTITDLEYDAVLFWIYLDEHYGGVNMLEDIMQQTTSQDGIYAVNATLSSKGTTFTEVFEEWSIVNFLKDSYYSKGGLFDPIATSQFVYTGTGTYYNGDVVDWGVDYYDISSSVIYMPIQFAGLQSHNLTKILIEHGLPLVSGFPLNSSHAGVSSLMQANNLDDIVIIVRSLGNETSTNRISYSLTFPSSTITLQGPYHLTSSNTTLSTIKTTGSHFSSLHTFTTVKTTSYQSSSTSIFTAVSSSGCQNSSPKITTVVDGSSSQSSSEMPLEVTLLPAPVGGIYIPVNKLSLLAPYIGLTILFAVAVITIAYITKKKKRTHVRNLTF